jgi:L-threonylcarbamoyladenylate synthase
VATINSKKAPGNQYPHYATKTPIRLYTGDSDKTSYSIAKYLENNSHKIALLWHTGAFSSVPQQIKLDHHPIEAAPLLFSAMRELDREDIDEIVIQGFDDYGIGAAIMNRLVKAASVIVDV